MRGFLQDARHGLRLLVRAPGFTVVAVLTLALGIGANTAVFSMLRVALRSMFGPVPHPSRVERVWARNLTTGAARMPMSMPDFESVREQSRSFASLAAWTGASWLLDFGRGPVRVEGVRVTDGFFRVLDAKPALGREFHADAPLNAVISHRLWRDTYGADPAILGRSIDIEGLSYTIVGVMPENFWYQSRNFDVWLPPAEPSSGWKREVRAFNVVGRLQDGVTEEQATAELATIAQRLAREYVASNTGWTFVPISLWSEQMKRAGMTGVFLFAPVLFVLLIACGNVGTMLLARGSVRWGEIAIRAALGGSRLRLIRQLLTESLLLSFGGALAGFAFAAAGIRLIIALLPSAEAAGARDMLHVDLPMFAFSLAVALLTSVLFGLTPALAATSVDLNTALKERESSGASRTRQRSRERLIAFEVGTSLILLVVTAAFARGIARIQANASQPGFEPRGLITFEISPAESRHQTPAQVAEYHRELQARLAAIPGVRSAGATAASPLGGGAAATRPIALDPALPGNPQVFASPVAVTPGYFESAQIPLLRGRTLALSDNRNAPPVACVSAGLARRFWPSQDPLGKRIRTGDANTPWLTIVGVVGDVLDEPIGPAMHQVLEASLPRVYIPHAQDPARSMVFTVRPTGDPAAIAPAIRRVVWNFDRGQDLGDLQTASQRLHDRLSGAWTIISLMAAFALIGLLLAATGVYGVMSFLTAQRTREIGVRLALGASPARILRQIIGRGAARIVLGLAVGLAISSSFLFIFHSQGTTGDSALLRPADPVPYLLAGAALSLAALLGTYIPARRASRVDPMIALRCE